MISWSGCLRNRGAELRRERDRLTVDRDDHVVDFDAGSVGHVAVVDRAERMGEHSQDPTSRYPRRASGCGLRHRRQLSEAKGGSRRHAVASARCWLEITRCAKGDADQIGRIGNQVAMPSGDVEFRAHDTDGSLTERHDFPSLRADSNRLRALRCRGVAVSVRGRTNNRVHGEQNRRRA